MVKLAERKPYFAESPVALVIGCGDMGLGCARALGVQHPLLLVDINQPRLDSCVATLANEGYQVSGYQCDIADAVKVDGLHKKLATGPGVKVLAHVAAVAGADIPWRTVMTIDLLGAHLIARAVAPHLVRGGVAILISSTGSYQCPRDPKILSLLDDPFRHDFLDELERLYGQEPDFLTAYFMAKQGVNRLARHLAVEWGKHEVRALSVSPGLINSTMGRTDGKAVPLFDGSDQKKLASREEKAAREVPLGRQGTILEITRVVAFLASDAASFINGVDIPIDGGSRAKAQIRQMAKDKIR